MALIKEKWLDPEVRAKLSSDIAGTFTITNNQTSASNVTGLLVDEATGRSVKIEYSIIRHHTDYKHEIGTFFLYYNPVSAAWNLVAETFGGLEAGVTFSITAGGQVQYVSSNLAGTLVTSTLKYVGKYL
jgi:hypothetical protein